MGSAGGRKKEAASEDVDFLDFLYISDIIYEQRDELGFSVLQEGRLPFPATLRMGKRKAWIIIKRGNTE